MKYLFLFLFLFVFIFFSCEKEETPKPEVNPVAVENPSEEATEDKEEEAMPDENNSEEESPAENVEVESGLNFLALGDSYTIGQGVKEKERWPVILADRLRESGLEVNKPEIIARTGWTTADLKLAIELSKLSESYDMVALLIGVNNQYQGLSLSDYQNEFRELLSTAIKLAGGRKENVFVLSIPDYSVTPFASGSNQTKINEELRIFNESNKRISEQAGVQYFNITPISQNAKNDLSLLAADQLHPSGKMYAQWVNLILPEVLEMVEE